MNSFTFLLVASALAADPDPAKTAIPLPYAPLQDSGLELIHTPPEGDASQGHARWISAISGAEDSLQMTMFHLTDPDVVNALIAAQKRMEKNHPGVDPADLSFGVHVLLDHDFFADPSKAPIIAQLKAGDVSVRPASDTFQITHVKTMVLDGKTIFLTAMNMTTNEDHTRDFGVITRDTGVITEVNSVFKSDWENYQREKPLPPLTPPLRQSALVWSPVTSEDKIVALINSARPGTALLCSTESVTDARVEQAFLDAAKRGVSVKFLAPQCDENVNPLLNLDPMKRLNSEAGSNIAFVMPGTGTANVPYIHSKMCLANYDPRTGKGGVAYVGSVNLSTNSMQRARELGIVFQNDAANKQLYKYFTQDLRKALNPAAPNFCPPPKQPNVPTHSPAQDGGGLGDDGGQDNKNQDADRSGGENLWRDAPSR
jgi:cardiolipin synthase